MSENEPIRFCSPFDVGRGSFYNITTPLSARFHPRCQHLVFTSDNSVTSSKAKAKLQAKHANCSVV